MIEPTDSALGSPDGLFARARTGDQAAWRELFDACYPKVLRVIRRRLNSPAMRSLYDSTDFVGDVWRSLAEKPDKYDFPTVQHLVAFLSTSAERKVIDEHRRLHAQKNDIGRQRSLAGGSRPDEKGGDLPSDDPTASQIVQEKETREQIYARLAPDERHVLDLKWQGYDTEEIAEKVEWHVRKVQRFLKAQGESWSPDGWEGRE